MNFGIDINDPRTLVSKNVRHSLIKIFSHLSASRRSIITETNQRSLFQRVSLFGLSVSSEVLLSQDKHSLTELLNFSQKYLHLNSDFKLNQPPIYAEVFWRAVFRLSLVVLSKGAGFLDEPTICIFWKLIHLTKKKEMDNAISIVQPGQKKVRNGRKKNYPRRGNYTTQQLASSGSSYILNSEFFIFWFWKEIEAKFNFLYFMFKQDYNSNIFLYSYSELIQN